MTQVPLSVDAPATRQARPSRFRSAVRTMLRDRIMLISFLLLVFLIAISVFAPLIATHDPLQLSPRNRLQGASSTYWFGTDSLGRDVFSRVLYGGRLSISLALLVCVSSIAGGLVVGIVAGYFRKLDSIIMRVMDGIMAIPGLLLAIAMVALGGAQISTMVFAIAVPEVPRIARLVRSVVLSVREEPFVEASFGMGSSTLRVLGWHILPSTINPLVIQAAYVCAAAILTEAVLGFLGAGFPPEVPSLGSIIAEGRPFFQRAPWIILFPGAFLALLILAINLFGDALRDRLDPRLARKTKG